MCVCVSFSHTFRGSRRFGKTFLTSTEARKPIGHLFVARNNVNLHTDILGTPYHFWEKGEFEPVYQQTRFYLEIEKRLEVIDKRLVIMREMLQALRDELETAHATSLEWTIILLIVAEVCITIIYDILLKGVFKVLA